MPTERNKFLDLLYKYKDKIFNEIVGVEDVDPSLRHVEIGSDDCTRLKTEYLLGTSR